MQCRLRKKKNTNLAVRAISIKLVDFLTIQNTTEHVFPPPCSLLRELLKAFVAFSPTDLEAGSTPTAAARVGVATGAWGCGAFGGDMQLKAVIQWLAASEVREQSTEHPKVNKGCQMAYGMAVLPSIWRLADSQV